MHQRTSTSARSLRQRHAIARRAALPPARCAPTAAGSAMGDAAGATAPAEEDWTPEQRHFMELALEQAQKAMAAREVPVGCVIVRDGQVIGSGHNLTNARRNGTAHAEFMAIDEILQAHGGDAAEAEFHRCTLYVTVEPCIMCAAALALVGIGHVVYGCGNDKFGGAGSILDVHQMGAGLCNGAGYGEGGRWGSVVKAGRGFSSRGGLYAERAVKALQDFYICGNPLAPKPHRPLRLPQPADGQGGEQPPER